MEPHIPGFEILGPIGSGAMSTVWRARETRSGRVIALKVLHPHVALTPGLLDRFLQEVKAYERLRHPNVISCLADGREGDQWYVALEHLEGGDLRSLLKATGRFPPETAAFVLGGILEALAHAHAAGVVHRDVKPENVMIAADGTVKLADFGISTAADSGHLTEAGRVLGTPAYVAPEQARGGEASPRSDLWSAGVVLHEIVTGINPFAAEQASAALARVETLSPAPLGYRAAGVPERLEDIAVWLLARDVEARPARAEEALELLRPLLAAGGPLATREGLRELMADPAGTVARARAARAAERIGRARALAAARPPRLAAAAVEALEAQELDPAAAGALAAELAPRAGARATRLTSPRAAELEREAEERPASLAPILNLVRIGRAEGDLLLAARAYRWGRRRSGEDRFAFAQLAAAAGLELAAHLEGLDVEALRTRLHGRGLRAAAGPPARPLLSSPVLWAGAAALVAVLAWDRWFAEPPPAAARPPRRAQAPTPAPLDPWQAVLERAEAVADDGDLERALAIYTLFLTEVPGDRRIPLVRLRAARALEELGRHEAARRMLGELLEQHPASDVAHAARRRMVVVLEAAGEIDAALEALEAVGEGRDGEERASLKLQRARLLERRGDLDAALALYAEVGAGSHPDYLLARARLGQGRVLVERGDGEALAWLAEASRRASPDSDVAREASDLLARLAAVPPPEP